MKTEDHAWRALNEHATVNLTRPDVTVQVEVRSDAAYFFSGVIRGPGGLLLGLAEEIA